MVGTFRRDDLHRGHPLRPLLVELSRAGLDRIELGGFNRQELGAQLAGILGKTPAGSVVEEVLARSNGNAFYAEELVAASLAGEVGVPISLRDVILSRVEGLPEATQTMLGAMAAVGCRVGHALLEEIVEVSEVDLDDALAAALAAGVLALAPPDGYRFRHALIAEAPPAPSPHRRDPDRRP
jgi:predicted ATPase